MECHGTSSAAWQSVYAAVIEIVKKFYDERAPSPFTETINERDMYMRLDVSEMLRESFKRSQEELQRSMRDIDLSKYVPKR